MIQRFLADEGGATAVEYGLMALVVAVIAIVAMTDFGESGAGKYDYITAAVTTATSGS
jgi:pilus assembly protein Flp/PilA